MLEPPDTLIARAAEHYRAGDHDAAARCGVEIIRQDKAHFDALHLLGVLCARTQHWADSAAYLARAERARPGDARCNFNRGLTLSALKLFPEAIEAFRRTIELMPNHAEAWNSLGIALQGCGRNDDAAENYQALLQSWPNYPAAHFNFGNVLTALGRPGDAIAHYRAALVFATETPPPDRLVDAAGAFGRALLELDRVEDALAVCQDMHRRLPGESKLVWNASLALLHLGDYAAGWRQYEARWQVKEHDRMPDGASVPTLDEVIGKRIHLVGEQGRGDILQFARFAPLLAARGAIVSLGVYDDLTKLLASLPGINAVVGEDAELPPHDILTPLLSLPFVFGTRLETVPAGCPYLWAPPDRLQYWRQHLGADAQPRVGVAWGDKQRIPQRSVPLKMLRPLLDCLGVSFHSLQKEIIPTDRDWLERDGRIQDHSASLTDFAETAALIEALDLVVTIDTSVAHLAGAMGKPVWIMLPFSAEWRWLRLRGDSPWYPTARLFRQPSPGDWGGLVARMVPIFATQLADWRYAKVARGHPCG